MAMPQAVDIARLSTTLYTRMSGPSLGVGLVVLRHASGFKINEAREGCRSTIKCEGVPGPPLSGRAGSRSLPPCREAACDRRRTSVEIAARPNLQVAKTSTWFYSGSHSLSVALSDGVTGNLMSKKMIKPGRDLLARVNQAFLAYGYSGLSMVVLARACGFTQRALYYYFSNKEQAFRWALAARNDEVVALGLEAGKAMRAKGGSALDIIAETLDVRYGNTRRRVAGSPHTVELNAEAFKRCRDIMIQTATAF